MIYGTPFRYLTLSQNATRSSNYLHKQLLNERDTENHDIFVSFSSIIIGFGIFTDQVDEAVENGSEWKSCLSPTKIQR